MTRMGMGLGELFGEAIRIMGRHPIIIIPAVVPSLWALIAPFIGLIGPAALLTTGYYDIGIGMYIVGLLVYVLVYILLLILSQGATVALVRDAYQGGYVSFSDAMGEAFSRFGVLFLASLLAGLMITIGSLLLVVPGLILGFFLWYMVQGIIVDDETASGAISASFRFAGANAGETFVVILVAIIVTVILGFIPFVGWLLMIPTTAYFATVSTLLYLERG